ncbi:MAG TPA: SUF system NifU family Fe-S cluster assembly protein [Fimbriimonadales bacterium]|jgi:nitrogen fixation NifU-like protein|nr:SUF system NifU family Fe-S cluster assembly protein [Fimbriimonadales bacterium]
MNELRDLYQEVILDHARNPRNFGECALSTNRAVGNNTLCGDRVEISLQVNGGVIVNAAFFGAGCAISTASASMMTEAIKGKTVTDALTLFERFHTLLTESADADDYGKLAVFAGVREFPIRVKCATLAWHTMKAALENSDDEVTTE